MDLKLEGEKWVEGENGFRERNGSAEGGREEETKKKKNETVKGRGREEGS